MKAEEYYEHIKELEIGIANLKENRKQCQSLFGKLGYFYWELCLRWEKNDWTTHWNRIKTRNRD